MHATETAAKDARYDTTPRDCAGWVESLSPQALRWAAVIGCGGFWATVVWGVALIL